jgi:zinc transporter ZupT
MRFFGFLRKRKARAKAEPWVIHGLITLHESFEGILIFGGIGSGKTTGPGQEIAMSLLTIGMEEDDANRQ